MSGLTGSSGDSGDVWSGAPAPGDGLSTTQRQLLTKLQARPGEWLRYAADAGLFWEFTDTAITMNGLRRQGLVEVYEERTAGTLRNFWVRVPAPPEGAS